MNAIARLNDEFRRSFAGGKVTMTAGVNALPAEQTAAALAAVQQFNDFTKANDPHGEHDFGSFELGGENFFFKIDYYDETCTYGSEDPADEDKTTRVLTVMLASEY
jgi:hypothetical protein